MVRPGEEVVDRRLLDHLAGVHHGDAVTEVGDHTEVVSDEQDAEPELALELAEEVEDLRLDGHVERGGRLVGDEEARRARQRHREHHALAHPTRELMRELVCALLGVGDRDEIEHLQRAATRRVPSDALVEPHGLLELVADGVRRVEARERVLEHHRDPRTADLAHVVERQLEKVATVEPHRSSHDAAGR